MPSGSARDEWRVLGSGGCLAVSLKANRSLCLMLPHGARQGDEQAGWRDKRAGFSGGKQMSGLPGRNSVLWPLRGVSDVGWWWSPNPRLVQGSRCRAAGNRRSACGEMGRYGHGKVELMTGHVRKPSLPFPFLRAGRLTAWVVALAAVLWGMAPGALRSDDAETSLTPSLKRIYVEGLPRNLDDLRLMDKHQRELVKRVSQTVVAVQIGQTQGSGVIIHEDGYVLTAAHVAGQAGLDVRMQLADGSRVRGTTLGMNKGMDAGMIKITQRRENGTADTKWPFANMGASAQLRAGSWCLALGHPGGFQDGREPVARFGRVLSNSKTVVETDCILVGGDSGGPLFDMEGDVIGIHSRIGSKLSKNLHVPVDAYRDDWARMVRGDTWGSLASVIGRPAIGVLGEKHSDDARIAQVLPESPAERAGVRAGDLVVKLGAKDVKTFDELKQLVLERNPGDEVEIVVLRGDEKLTFQVVLGAVSETE